MQILINTQTTIWFCLVGFTLLSNFYPTTLIEIGVYSANKLAPSCSQMIPDHQIAHLVGAQSFTDETRTNFWRVSSEQNWFRCATLGV